MKNVDSYFKSVIIIILMGNKWERAQIEVHINLIQPSCESTVAKCSSQASVLHNSGEVSQNNHLVINWSQGSKCSYDQGKG